MRTAATLALACVLALTACTGQDPDDATAPEAPPDVETVVSGALTACIAPTPVLAERDGGTWRGYDIGVLEAVADELGLELELVEASFDELVSGVALNGGRCDVGAAGVVDHDGLDSVVRTSAPYRTVHRVVVATTAGAEVAPGEVAGAVGVLEGGSAADTVAALDRAEVVSYPSSADLRRALAEGVVDAALVTVMERAELEAELDTPLHVRSRVETDDATVLLLPLGAEDADVETVDAALGAAREDGRLASLANQWLRD